MPRMQFGITAFERARGDLPALPVINMFAEEAPTEESGLVLQSRPGLEAGDTLGDGPVRALFQEDGVLSGERFAVSGSVLYAGSTVVGSINGTGPVSMDGYENLLFIAAGGSLWGYDGTTLAAITFPDTAAVTKVVVGASRAICLRADTEMFYWSDVLSDTIGGLNFASAESQPDRLRDVLFLDDALILFGAGTVEFWPNTSDANLPFQPLEGRVFERGIKATGCATQFGGTFAWVTDINQVCLGDPENVLSNPGMETDIEASANVALWSFNLEGTEFLALRIDTGTWVRPAKAGTWHNWTSYGFDNWIPQCFAAGNFGSAESGLVCSWGSGHLDLGGTLERRFRAGFPLNSGGVTVDNILLRCNTGQTPFLVGDYVEPTVEMRLSHDAGQTWGEWEAVSLGAQGEYGIKVMWAALGMASQPGLLAEFRTTAPVPFRVSDVLINETYGGRS